MVLPVGLSRVRRHLGVVRRIRKSQLHGPRRHESVDSVPRPARHRRRRHHGLDLHHRRRYLSPPPNAAAIKAFSPACGDSPPSSDPRWAAGSPITFPGAPPSTSTCRWASSPSPPSISNFPTFVRSPSAAFSIGPASSRMLACIGPLLLAFTWVTEYGWGSGRVETLLVIAVAMLIAFLYSESKAVEPLIPLTLFKDPVIRVCFDLHLRARHGHVRRDHLPAAVHARRAGCFGDAIRHADDADDAGRRDRQLPGRPVDLPHERATKCPACWDRF